MVLNQASQVDGGVATAVGLGTTHERARKTKRTLLNQMTVLSSPVLYLIVIKTIDQECDLVVPRNFEPLDGLIHLMVLYVSLSI